MEIKPDVVVIEGGLAGLTATIHLSKFGLKVTLIEKNEFPKHNVCGEYISNEVLSYLQELDLMLSLFNSILILILVSRRLRQFYKHLQKKNYDHLLVFCRYYTIHRVKTACY